MSLRAVIAAELEALPAGARPFDVHAHTGADIDGTLRSCEEHVEVLAAVDGRSVIFPLCVTGGYDADNRRVIDECGRHSDVLVPFARLDPRTVRRAEVEGALAAGARGFKLHPRAEQFRLDHPGVETIIAVAEQAGAPVLIHAGVGIGSLGTSVVELAESHRSCPMVLAHAAVSDLAWLGPLAREHPNLFFDTSWWNPTDLLALFALVPPGQILFGSDEPYMDLQLVLSIAHRCAHFAGLSAEAVRLVFGGQLEALLACEPAIDAGPAPGATDVAATPGESRLATLLAAAGGCMLGGGDPSQILELARVAIDGVRADSQETVAVLIDEAETGEADAPWAVAMAMTVVTTPGVETLTASG